MSLPHPRESGFCILRILDIFSACEVWFTFVFRTQEHRAVGSSGNGLTYSRGDPPSSRLPYPRLLYPYCITTWVICQEVFRNFLKFLFKQHHSLGRCGPPVVSLVTGDDSLSFLLTPLLYHNLGDLSRGFLHFFRRVEHRLTYCPAGCPSPSPLDTISIPQTTPKVNW